MTNKKMAITSREKDFSIWYNELVEQAELVQNSDVRGCMVIRPYGYAIRENMKEILDQMFKKTGHQNAYFPLLIPKSYLSKEASHIEGFAKECAVVTHYRLKNDPNGKGVIVDPEAKLEEELIIRPTSETIIRNSYKQRIHSYRDLPILINQRANVMRREMRTRAFLRTSEFLWQEGHTAHASSQEAIDETIKMRNVYNDFFENFLGMSGIMGKKSENEKFAGAVDTYTIEHIMQDGKSLQSCTSHFLGQNFAKAMDAKFTNKNNELEYARATSWGASTRMIGGLIMSHSDDKGLILPPAIAPIHVVIIPIFKTDEEKEKVMNYLNPILANLGNKKITFNSPILGNHQIDIKIKIDDDENRSMGWKYNQYELQGVPVRIGTGPRDIEKGQVEVFVRHKGTKEFVNIENVADYVSNVLDTMTAELFKANKEFRANNTVSVDNYDDFKKAIDQGKFVMAHWDGTTETELRIKEETKATIRCISDDEAIKSGNDEESKGLSEETNKGGSDQMTKGKCVMTGKDSPQRVLFARAY